MDVLLQEGAIESEVASNLVDHFRADVRIEVSGGGVARRQVQDDENEGDDADQERNCLRQPAADVAEQLGFLLLGEGHRFRNVGRIHQSITETQSPRMSMSTPFRLRRTPAVRISL